LTPILPTDSIMMAAKRWMESAASRPGSQRRRLGNDRGMDVQREMGRSIALDEAHPISRALRPYEPGGLEDVQASWIKLDL
jgi:hypothetical protein